MIIGRHLDSDVQFGVAAALTGDFRRHDGPRPGDPGPRDRAAGEPWWTLDVTLTLAPGKASLPRPPVR